MHISKEAHSFTVTAATPSVNEDKGLEAIQKDDDPEGLKLISASDPLEQAAKLLVPLSNLAASNIDVWFAIYDVAIRRSTSNKRRSSIYIQLLQENCSKP